MSAFKLVKPDKSESSNPQARDRQGLQLAASKVRVTKMKNLMDGRSSRFDVIYSTLTGDLSANRYRLYLISKRRWLIPSGERVQLLHECDTKNKNTKYETFSMTFPTRRTRHFLHFPRNSEDGKKKKRARREWLARRGALSFNKLNSFASLAECKYRNGAAASHVVHRFSRPIKTAHRGGRDGVVKITLL